MDMKKRRVVIALGGNAIQQGKDATANAQMVAIFNAVFGASATGSVQFFARVSATGAPVNIQRGTWLRVYKIG